MSASPVQSEVSLLVLPVVRDGGDGCAGAYFKPGGAGAGLRNVCGSLAVVPAARLGERPAPAMVSSGIAELDALAGGLPRGGLTEICGPASSGRTSVLLSVLAEMTRRGEVCALVDVSDRFDPHSAAAAGVELRRLLWVRCGENRTQRHRDTEKISNFQISNFKSMDRLAQALKATDLLLQGGGFGLVAVDLGDIAPAAARRVPLASWFRFRRAVENTPTVLLVIEQEPYAKSCASVVIRMSAVDSRRSTASGQWPVASGQQKESPSHAHILHGLQITAELLRSATQGKKPVRSAAALWESKTAWAG